MALLERLRRRLGLLWFALTMPRLAGAADDPPADDPPKDDPPADDPPKDDPDDDKVDKDDDWKTKSRKNERLKNKAERERDEARQKLKDRESADQTEQEKAINKAREEARNEALTEAEKERRSDRLEVAVTRLAAKGIKVAEGDDAKTVRFADSEDALLHIQREADELFDDENKVNADALEEALRDLLKRKPHLAEGEGKTPPADPDTRKGDPADGDMESWTPEQHAQRKYGGSSADPTPPMTGARGRN